jgi:hypothetical protein
MMRVETILTALECLELVHHPVITQRIALA